MPEFRPLWFRPSTRLSTVVYTARFDWNAGYTLRAGKPGCCLRKDPGKAGNGARDEVNAVHMDDPDISWMHFATTLSRYFLIARISLRKGKKTKRSEVTEGRLVSSAEPLHGVQIAENDGPTACSSRC
jgi:hypothetical protein